MKCLPSLPTLLLACGLAVPPSHAMGPAAPFAPPGREAAAAPALSADAGGASGLSGVRLGRHAGALIDGAWVALGARVRSARLEAVQRDRVVLRRPDGSTETLTLYPATAASAASAATSASTASAER